MSEVTRLLDAAERGETRAAEALLPLVYDELRRLAAHKVAGEQPGQTLQPTALVHEAWIRLVGQPEQHWQNRRHFFSAAAEAMRRILIDRARRRMRQKHGGGLKRLDLDQLDLAATVDDEMLLVVNEALNKLNQVDPGFSRV